MQRSKYLDQGILVNYFGKSDARTCQPKPHLGRCAVRNSSSGTFGCTRTLTLHRGKGGQWRPCGLRRQSLPSAMKCKGDSGCENWSCEGVWGGHMVLLTRSSYFGCARLGYSPATSYFGVNERSVKSHLERWELSVRWLLPTQVRKL
jgi:hypothetical protein